MSFILDALRKSDLERKRHSGPGMAEFQVAREERRQPLALIAIGVLLAVNVAVVLYFVLRDARTPAAEATQVAVAGGASVSSVAPPAASAQADVAPKAVAPAAGPSPLASEVVPPAELSAPAIEFYGAPATLPPDAPDPTLLPEASVATEAGAVGGAGGAGGPGGGVAYGLTPPEDAQAAQAATGLPELSVDLHIFSDDPAKRAVFINGRRYTQGAQIAEGPRVEEITREGAMLSYRGRRFLLPRL
jgi:general secretion pathway protein B